VPSPAAPSKPPRWTVEDRCSSGRLKHALYIVRLRSVITHLFLAYFVSLQELWAMMQARPRSTGAPSSSCGIFAGILYFNFAWFREQLCIVICPYGRLQSALIDDHSMVIGYDKRGEPRRAKRGKAGTPGSGDCIACNRCVQVCPTGIDIRHGLQLECIGCTACIDACDEVMTRIHKPRGLIRYDSKTACRRHHPLAPAAHDPLRRSARCRRLVAGWAISTIKPASVGVTRMTGAPTSWTRLRAQPVPRPPRQQAPPR
jgi:cytochrome c oxidase accessory protein FixG